MSAKATPDIPPSASKPKKNKKKKPKHKDPSNHDTADTADITDLGHEEDRDEDGTSTPTADGDDTRDSASPSRPLAGPGDDEERETANLAESDVVNGTSSTEDATTFNGSKDDTEQRLEAASRERDRLKAEVTDLRRSLEELRLKHLNGSVSNAENVPDEGAAESSQLRSDMSELRQSMDRMQQQHEEELAGVNASLEQTQAGKELAETRYQKLLGQVNTIKTQLGERLKADAEDLSQARTQIEDLEEQLSTLRSENNSLQTQLSQRSSSAQERDLEIVDLREEVSTLRGRANNSQKDWAKERDELVSREAQVREEFETARQAMQDWEVLALEERSIREGMNDRVADLEDLLSNQRDAYERAVSERDSQSVTVDGLQRALQEIQDARKTELREVVENSEMQLEDLRKHLKTAEESASSAQTALESTRQDLERAIPFEKEVREKNLLIGKLRHEGVILNDHLTKALRFLKKGKPEDNVDRQLVTNHLLHFFALDRSDPKKFQVLQLISALLGWTEEQNEQAGLARPGASSQPMNPAQHSSLRAPLSPFRRVSSSTSLNSPRSPSASMSLNNIFTSPLTGSGDPISTDGAMGQRSDSLADLWSSFLEREALEGAGSKKGHSRRTSLNSTSGGTLPKDSERRKETSIREDGGET